MRFLALAADYDGTIAHDGAVAARTVDALQRLGASGRKLILVTGRELDELLQVFPEIELFDLVVAENGALLYTPSTRASRELGDPPPPGFVAELERRAVTPLSVGRSIVATVHPNETIVLDVIRSLGLELQVIFNKGAVMVLPANVNKASGLLHALAELDLSPRNVAAIGDAENDHAMLRLAEYGVATGNAIETLKLQADRASEKQRGDAVIELCEDLIAHDLARTPPRLPRREILLGTRGDGTEVRIPPAGINVLVAGSSGSGKSTLATGILERAYAEGYQLCVIDPEGDYEDFPEAVVLGAAGRAPTVSEILTALAKPGTNVVVNLIGLPLQDRPAFFLQLLPHLQGLRAQKGRPHWLLVDEAHHLMPRGWQPTPEILIGELAGTLYVTVHPDLVDPQVLRGVQVVAALGDAPAQVLQDFASIADVAPPPLAAAAERPAASGEALVWLRGADENAGPHLIEVAPSRTDRRRHRRKYAEGELPPDRSFFFRGPEGKLNLRAQNLILFLQLADGVDDATWLHHLRRGDYSRWIGACIKDPAVAEEVAAVERQGGDPRETRGRIRAVVEEHYTLPAAAAGAP